ncbi:MAG: hypothetical protein ACT4QF_19390 [Sporichthyaceae bacterium]
MGDQLPLWIGVAAALGIPLLAFAGSVAGQLLSRRDARDLDVRWQREETMRLLRWAAELAVDPAQDRKVVGLAALTSLGGSQLLQPVDQALVRGVLDSVVGRARRRYDEDAVVREES